MVDVNDAVIARLKKQGHNFEVLVDCDNALMVKEGKDMNITDLLAVEKIFTDAKRGEVASEHIMKEVFGTDDVFGVAVEIIRKGEIQLTAEHRKKTLEQKQKRIMGMIHRHGIDPKTGFPHPMTRIENAFEAGKIRIDEHTDDNVQMQEIIKKLMPILPIKIVTKRIQMRIPAEFAQKSQHAVRSLGKVVGEEWQNDGSLVEIIEIPGGLEQDLYEAVNAVCHGSMEAKVIETR